MHGDSWGVENGTRSGALGSSVVGLGHDGGVSEEMVPGSGGHRASSDWLAALFGEPLALCSLGFGSALCGRQGAPCSI